LAYLCFAVSREPVLRRWHHATHKDLWERCGFASKPSYDTTHDRFARLEDYSDVFREMAQTLIKRATEGSDGRVGFDIHVDGTEAETHARLHHDCASTDRNCAQRRRRAAAKAALNNHGASDLAPHITTGAARGERQLKANLDPDTDPDVSIEEDITGNYRRVKFSNGCWYRTADKTAGTRAYVRNGKRTRFWHGYYNLKAIDHYTGAVIAVKTVSASVNEHIAYPQFLAEIMENIDGVPRAIVGDRGFSVSSVYETNTKLGIASVFPWRSWGRENDRGKVECDLYDRHGVPRCQHCGASSQMVRFQSGDSPRLWFRCLACGLEGSIRNSKAWRHLLPLWRTDGAYHVLRHTHQQHERAHKDWRERWLVGPDTYSIRPRRVGIGCHELRAQAALFLEWLNVCWREGWLGGQRLNDKRPYEDSAKEFQHRMNRYREKYGFHLPTDGRHEHQRQLSIREKQATDERAATNLKRARHGPSG
jgi:hypothetical protein